MQKHLLCTYLNHDIASSFLSRSMSIAKSLTYVHSHVLTRRTNVPALNVYKMKIKVL